MIDVTTDIQLFRETARHVWNSSIASTAASHPGETSEAFDQICEELFYVVVLMANGIDESVEKLNGDGFRSLKVVPLIAEGTPIMVNRTAPAGPYWDDPVVLVKPAGIDLSLIGFFDWDSFANIDLRYLRVRVEDAPGYPTIIGRQALVDVSHAKVVLRQ
jgi:hypothetical protein